MLDTATFWILGNIQGDYTFHMMWFFRPVDKSNSHHAEVFDHGDQPQKTKNFAEDKRLQQEDFLATKKYSV